MLEDVQTLSGAAIDSDHNHLVAEVLYQENWEEETKMKFGK